MDRELSEAQLPPHRRARPSLQENEQEEDEEEDEEFDGVFSDTSVDSDDEGAESDSSFNTMEPSAYAEPVSSPDSGGSPASGAGATADPA